MMDNQDDLDKITEVLNSIQQNIKKKGNMKNFRDLIQTMHSIQNKELLHICYNNGETELISLICKYNKKKYLHYLFYESHILHYLASEDKSTDSEKYKVDALYYAMCSNNLEILEMLYDYWSGDLHWLGHKKEYDKFDVENLKQLNSLLTCAFNRYKVYIQMKKKIYPENIISIESLIAFNVFQIELYSKLNDLKGNLTTWEDESEDIIRIQETYAIKNMIIALFDIYERHSELSLLGNSILDLNDKNVEGYLDNSSLSYQTSLFVIYETFYRKLDYNLCLLILDNLHLLKLRLSMSKNSYQIIENKVYYFIYHISNKWSFYLPKRKHKKVFKVSCHFKGKLCSFSINSSDTMSENAYNSIYLERREFENAMKCFINELKNINIEENIRKSQSKLPNEDSNYLMLLPHLRDDYSLKRISQHISQLYSMSFKYEKKYVFLFIERTLQVVGEFLKSTDESLHLQPSTEALVKSEISVEVVNDLKALRNLLCHTKNGEFLKRIEVEVNNTNIFDLILQELLYVKKKIDQVIKLHNPILVRDLTQNALNVLSKRQYEMPEMVAHVHFTVINAALQIPIDFIRRDIIEKYYEETWVPQGYSHSLLKELSMLADYCTQLISKRNIAIKNIYKNVTLKLPFYSATIKNSLNIILIYIEKWQEIVKTLKKEIPSIDLSDYPNENDANKIKSKFTKVTLGSDSPIQFTEVNELFANVERHWKFIENLLQFIVKKTRIFDNTIEELKFEFYTYHLNKLMRNKYTVNTVEKEVNEYLELMKEKVNSMNIGKKTLIRNSYTNLEKIPEFTGIKEFTKKLMTSNILTQEERIYLVTILDNKNHENDIKKRCAIELMIENIKTDTAIPKKEHTKFTKLINLDIKSQKVLMNLVMGHKRNPMLPQCLSKRLFLLSEIIQGQSTNHLLLRYKLDNTFRVLLEVLLFDIFIIMESNKTSPVLKKSSKLLTEINLRNILTHGSPLLEVVGNVLDANDLPTELITKALDFIEDKRSVDAMCALCELDFNFSEINNTTHNAEHRHLVDEFKMSCRWKDYLKLLPDYKQIMYEKRNKKTPIDKSSMELLAAINKRDAALVKNCIDNGANVNFIDNHKKAIIHYAAMKGNVNILDILLNNGADVNIVNKENNLTALHYSAMNNFIDSVNFLLENGAKCHALDDKGRAPVYWANQRNHTSVSRILVKAMKKCNCYNVTH